MKMEDDPVLSEVGPEDGYLLVRIHVPELNVQKCLQFPRDQLVWDVKQQCLAALPKELKESFNYGLFCPPQNGKAGKFLDEERRLGDYPFNGPVGYLELKYKRRVYKMMNLDEKQLKALHTRANFRRLLDYVNNAQVEKITKMCSKGFDPNFHCAETGETPLTLATGIKKPSKVLIALVNGGAILDYRTKDGATALHRAVDHNSLEALTTLLELGASPNYKDAKGLTPLYLCVTSKTDPMLCETLLHDHAVIGAQDLQGWREVHQACRNGAVSHLEHLVFYGADMNVRNASGNTPLHVCAVNNQESCARLLLFRGCDKEALNYANQTPYQVAVIAGNLELAEIIQAHRPEEVVPYREPPRYKPGRRGNRKSFYGEQRMDSTTGRLPSPSLSLRSLCPFSSASSSLSETSSASGGSNSASYISNTTDKSLGDTSDIISDSSGVGTSNSDMTNPSITLPGTTVVCVESYTSGAPGHISITQGDIIEVTGATDDGYLEGNLRNQGTGLFPAHCVQEVRLRTNPNIPMPMQSHGINTVGPQRSASSSRVQGRRETQKHFATAPRLKKTLPAEPRTVVLHRARKGFGFVLRGAKASSPLMELTPNERCPGLQYLDDVDKGGVADLAGLQKGDYLLAINGEDVSAASHEKVVDLIRKSGDLVQMTVVSLGPPTSLPSSKSTANISGTPPSRQYATLPRKLTNGPLTGTLGRSPAPLPPRRDPKTTLSVGRARAKCMVGSMGDEDDIENNAVCSSAESIHQQDGSSSTNSQPRTASIRARPISSRITASELEELFQRQRGQTHQPGLMSSSNFQNPSVPGSPAKTPRVYASVAEMKRSKSKGSHKVRFFGSGSKSNMAEMHRDFHSTPDLAIPFLHPAQSEIYHGKPHRSQEDIGSLFRPLPPNHPPPPIPSLGQIVKVETRVPVIEQGGILVSKGEYVTAKAGKNVDVENGEVMSSFRPTDNAKLYASPEDIKTVGFRSRPPQVRKSHSLRSPPRLSEAEDAQRQGEYAQPFRQASRSHSSVSEGGALKRHSLTLTRNSNPPPIPEPDYSLSESEDEETSQTNVLNLTIAGGNQEKETSGNSNSSGSSSNSALAHSFSVEEIQKVRTKLKSSKSYPNDFLVQQSVDGDGDNSSSGVSSDQEVPPGPQGLDDPDSRPSPPFQRQNSIRISNKTLANKQKTLQLISTAINSRGAVSLANLPPPIEDNLEDASDPVVFPPPPEFLSGNGTGGSEVEILAPPPPQFSDGKLVTRVRIVGSKAKSEFESKAEESNCANAKYSLEDGDDSPEDGSPPDVKFNILVWEKYSYYSQIGERLNAADSNDRGN